MEMKKFAALSLLVLSLPAVAFAGAAGDEPGFRVPGNFQGTADEGGSLFNTIITIVNALLAFAGLVAAIMMVMGGVRYITSQGDEDAVAGAKNTIIYSAVGIIVILVSAVIVNFVISTIA